MRALVTGASGFVGSHLVEHLLAEGDEVMGATYGVGNPLQCPMTTLDVTSVAECIRVFKQFDPQVIYHLAGIASPPLVSQDFAPALQVNVGGVHSVLKGASEMVKPPRVLVVSSGEVYGRADLRGGALTEEVTPLPVSEYSLSKLMAEEVAQLFARRGLEIIVARPFNHAGPRQTDHFVVSAFARQLAFIAAGRSEPIIRVGNLAPRRDFCDVRDIVRGYRALVSGRASGVFNLCSGRAVSIQEVLELLVSVSGVTVTIEQDPGRMRGAEIPVVEGSYEKINRATGWNPEYSLADTIADVYRWWASEGIKRGGQ